MRWTYVMRMSLACWASCVVAAVGTSLSAQETLIPLDPPTREVIGSIQGAPAKAVPSTAKPSDGAQPRRSAKLDVEGQTYVDLDSALEGVFTSGRIGSVKELRAHEIQQTKVAAAIQSVTVNVRQGPAQGSGVLIANNFVLTAAHVGGRPHQPATVVLTDGTELKAEVLGMNRNVDAGLLKILDTRGRTLPYATLGKSRHLKAGQRVIGAGHPGGWQSGRGAAIRSGCIKEILDDTLLTDVALIGGDSGGPLFNLKGELIAIHSRIGTDVSENMHVPIDTFEHDWSDLKKGVAWGVLPGYRPMIGVGLKKGESRAVLGLVEGPALEAGLEVEDIVTKFDGQPIETFQQLQDAVLTTLPGDIVKIEVMRGSEPHRFQLRVGVVPQ